MKKIARSARHCRQSLKKRMELLIKILELATRIVELTTKIIELISEGGHAFLHIYFLCEELRTKFFPDIEDAMSTIGHLLSNLIPFY